MNIITMQLNVSSSTSHKKTLELSNFVCFFAFWHIYLSILIKIYMNTNIIETHFIYKIKYHLIDN